MVILYGQQYGRIIQTRFLLKPTRCIFPHTQVLFCVICKEKIEKKNPLPLMIDIPDPFYIGGQRNVRMRGRRFHCLLHRQIRRMGLNIPQYFPVLRFNQHHDVKTGNVHFVFSLRNELSASRRPDPAFKKDGTEYTRQLI